MEDNKIFVNLFMEATTDELPANASTEEKPVENAPPEEEVPPEPLKSTTGLLGKANLLNDLSKLKVLSIKAKEVIIKNPEDKLKNLSFLIAKLNEIETSSTLFIRIVSDSNYEEIKKFVSDSLNYISTTLVIFKSK